VSSCGTSVGAVKSRKKLSAHPSFSYIALINLLLGSSIGLPLVYFGKAKLKRASRLLTQAESNYSALGQARRPDSLLTTGLADLPGFPVQGSVTEQTTLDLEKG